MTARTRILKLAHHDPDRELEFELKFLKSLTIQQRFTLMQRKSQELLALLNAHGYRRTPQIVKRDLIQMKRAANRVKDREDLQALLKLKKRT